MEVLHGVVPPRVRVMENISWYRHNTFGNVDALCKWKLRVAITLYLLKVSVLTDLLEHISEEKTPKEAWDSFAHCSHVQMMPASNYRKMRMGQPHMVRCPSHNFMKVKKQTTWDSELNREFAISEPCTRRIIITDGGQSIIVLLRQFVDD